MDATSERAISIDAGSVRQKSANPRMAGGMVAEKKSVWRLLPLWNLLMDPLRMMFSSAGMFQGQRFTIFLTMGRKPMSSMRSTSSRMSIFTSLNDMEPRKKWSTNLPGVATTMSAVFSWSSWAPYPTPPYRRATVIPVCSP